MGVDALCQIGMQCRAVACFCIQESVLARYQRLIIERSSEKVSGINDDASSSALAEEVTASVGAQGFVLLQALSLGLPHYDILMGFEVYWQNLADLSAEGCYRGRLFLNHFAGE